MRALCLLLLTFSLVGEASAFLDIFGGVVQGILGIFGKVIDWTVTSANKLVDTTFSVSGKVIGAVVDPFGIFKSMYNLSWGRAKADDHGHKTGEVAKCPAVADIIFVFDGSSSMSQSEFELEKSFAKRLTEHFKIGGDHVRFGAIVFSDSVQKLTNLGDSSDQAAFSRVLSSVSRPGGGTKTYLALDYIRNNGLFNTAAGARSRSSKIVIVITDGSSDSLFKTDNAAEALHGQGIDVISVGIGSGLGVELYNIASGWKDVFRADSFQDLVRIEQKVALRTCEIPASEGNVPTTGSGSNACQKGFEPNPADRSKCIDINECAKGTSSCQQKCVNTVGSFRCSCNAGNVIDSTDTTKCKTIQKCASPVDIIIVADASSSIGEHNFEIQQNYISKLPGHFNIGSDGALFGSVLFSNDVFKLFDLKTYSNRQNISQALREAEYLTGGTNTHLAFNYILQNGLFSAKSGGRSNAPDYVIVLTDGKSTLEDETAEAVAQLKQAGVIVIAVGIGDQISQPELLEIASTPKDVLIVSDFDLLDYIEQRLGERACPSKRTG